MQRTLVPLHRGYDGLAEVGIGYLGGKARVILTSMRHQQALGSLEFASRMLATAEHGSERILIGLIKFDAIA